jgi:hypothetical protein
MAQEILRCFLEPVGHRRAQYQIPALCYLLPRWNTKAQYTREMKWLVCIIGGEYCLHGIMPDTATIRRNLPLAHLLNVGIVGENVQGALGMIIVRSSQF